MHGEVGASENLGEASLVIKSGQPDSKACTFSVQRDRQRDRDGDREVYLLVLVQCPVYNPLAFGVYVLFFPLSIGDKMESIAPGRHGG